MNIKCLPFVKSFPSLGVEALPEGLQQTTEEEKEEIQGHILPRAWGFNSLTDIPLKPPTEDAHTAGLRALSVQSVKSICPKICGLAKQLSARDR